VTGLGAAMRVMAKASRSEVSTSVQSTIQMHPELPMNGLKDRSDA
jgi:hypothetical protein